MLDMGFAPDVEAILRECPKQRQTLLFSATMPDWVRRIAGRHMHDPVTIEVSTRPEIPEEVGSSTSEPVGPTRSTPSAASSTSPM